MKSKFAVFLLFVFLVACTNKTNTGMKGLDDYYEVLEEVLSSRKNQLQDYLKNIQLKAEMVQTDELMINFFEAKNNYYLAKKEIDIPHDIEQSISLLKQKIQSHYLANYRQFYDILFVNTLGDIFYTIRKQSDYHKNIFSEEMSGTGLSKQLNENPSKAFVDFQFYNYSGQPSAFYIQPVYKKGEHLGWLVLQSTINKINSIFYDFRNLPSSGEVLLVNKKNYLLSESRFNPKNTILKQQLSAENIEAKFKEVKGRKSVIDYRGRRVISAFDTFKLMDSDWLIIAKMDAAEAYTNEFKKMAPNDVHELMHAYQNTGKLPDLSAASPDSDCIEVDMDEFRRVEGTKTLYTHGVATCTVLSIALPGSFAYMAHISPMDKIYGSQMTDLLGKMLQRINRLEIRQFEKQELEFVIVSKEHEPVLEAIHQLLQEDIQLNQIKILTNEEAIYANVSCGATSDDVQVFWKFKDGSFRKQSSKEMQNMFEYLQETTFLK